MLDRCSALRLTGWDGIPSPARVLLIDSAGAFPVTVGSDGAPRLVAPRQPLNAKPGDIFLGRDVEGVAWVGRRVLARSAKSLEATAATHWTELRSVGNRLSTSQRSIVAEFVALVNWHQTHSHCPNCGAETAEAGLGWWRVCMSEGTEHFPRTDPAVIASVTDSEGNLLLGRQARWEPGAYSVLAGFVEAGEAAESAVRREVAEEVGLNVDAVTYVASQPWPFPASLMLGFRAEVQTVRPDLAVDGVEIVEALWISRADLPRFASAGEIRLPGRLSIAHRLIRDWFGKDLPDAWLRW